ncbi:MAG: hypothetical protein AAFQ23_11550 [Cyanobacteria bacterium J06623_1]
MTCIYIDNYRYSRKNYLSCQTALVKAIANLALSNNKESNFQEPINYRE